MKARTLARLTPLALSGLLVLWALSAFAQGPPVCADTCSSDKDCREHFTCTNAVSCGAQVFKGCVWTAESSLQKCLTSADCPKGLGCFDSSPRLGIQGTCDPPAYPRLAARPTNQGKGLPPCHSNADCPKHFECGQPAGDQCSPLWIKCTSRADCDPDEYCAKDGNPPGAGQCMSRQTRNYASTCLTNDDCPDRETCVMMREAWRGGTCTPVAGAQ